MSHLHCEVLCNPSLLFVLFIRIATFLFQNSRAYIFSENAAEKTFNLVSNIQVS